MTTDNDQKPTTFRLGVSRVQSTLLRRVIIIAAYPFMVALGLALLSFGIATFAVYHLCVGQRNLFRSAREAW